MAIENLMAKDESSGALRNYEAQVDKLLDRLQHPDKYQMNARELYASWKRLSHILQVAKPNNWDEANTLLSHTYVARPFHRVYLVGSLLSQQKSSDKNIATLATQLLDEAQLVMNTSTSVEVRDYKLDPSSTYLRKEERKKVKRAWKDRAKEKSVWIEPVLLYDQVMKREVTTESSPVKQKRSPQQQKK